MNLVTKDCFMCTVDLKDAYYSVKVKDEFQCYLKFQWKQKLLNFVCFPNGWVHVPEKVTKISKARTSDLRLRGVSISGFLDNFLTKASSYSQCEKNVHDVVIKFIRLGFTIHPTKTQLVSKQEIISLSFVVNSRTMTTALPANKKAHFKNITLERLTLFRLEREGGTLYIYQPIWFQKTPA